MKSSKKITAVDIIRRKSSGKTVDKLVMVTAYDATMTMLLESPLVDGDADHLDMLLVGDSLGMLVQGHDNTLPVTLEQMIYHTQCVARAATYAQVIADMPFMSYQVSVEQALLSAGRLVQEGRAHAVKLEGGAVYADRVNAIVNAGIPVVGHIGLTPQSVHRLGGFKVQGKDADGAKQLLNDALALQEAGCYAVVLEAIPQDLAGTITQALDIPTIGIGAGKHCDGQVLVCYDLLGMTPSFGAKFVKRYADMSVQIATAVHRFSAEVREGTFPTDAHSFSSTGQKIAESAPDTLTIAVKEAASVPREISIYGSGTVVRK